MKSNFGQDGEITNLVPGETKPSTRVDLFAPGLPKDFFEPGADTYRFVVWQQENDRVTTRRQQRVYAGEINGTQ